MHLRIGVADRHHLRKVDERQLFLLVDLRWNRAGRQQMRFSTSGADSRCAASARPPLPKLRNLYANTPSCRQADSALNLGHYRKTPRAPAD